MVSEFHGGIDIQILQYIQQWQMQKFVGRCNKAIMLYMHTFSLIKRRKTPRFLQLQYFELVLACVYLV